MGLGKRVCDSTCNHDNDNFNLDNYIDDDNEYDVDNSAGEPSDNLNNSSPVGSGGMCVFAAGAARQH